MRPRCAPFERASATSRGNDPGRDRSRDYVRLAELEPGNREWDRLAREARRQAGTSHYEVLGLGSDDEPETKGKHPKRACCGCARARGLLQQ